MKRLRIAAGLLLAALMAGMLTGCGLFPEEEEVLAPPLTEPTPVSYNTEKVERGTVADSTIIAGSFISDRVYDVSFEKRSGYLSELAVKVGESVKKGQVLARLDSDALIAEIERQKLLVQRAQIALDAAKAAPGATAESIKLAEIDYQLVKIQLDEQQNELSKQVIYAPADGTVSYVCAQGIGEYVAARSTVVRIVDPDSLLLECTGDTISDFPLNKEVVVTYEKEEYAGKVVMTPANVPAELKSDKPFIRIALTEEIPADDLMGRSAKVQIIRETKENVLIIPVNAVSVYNGEAYVYVLEDGLRKERPVQTGITQHPYIEVVSGLKEGEEVIVK